MKLSTKILTAGGILALAAVVVAPVSAFVNDAINPLGEDFGIAVSPGSIELDFVPDGNVTELVRVRNVGQLPSRLKIGVSPYSVTDESYTSDELTETPRTEITRWTTLSINDCNVYRTDNDGSLYVDFAFKEECNVIVNVAAPSNAPSGSQHMSIYFQEFKELPGQGMETIRSFSARVFAANANDKSNRNGCANILNQDIPFWTFEGPVVTSSRIENCGNLDFFVTTSIQVKNLLGGNIVHEDRWEDIGPNGNIEVQYSNIGSQRKIIMAETTRKVEDAWENAPIGIYEITQTVQGLREDHVVTRLAIVCPLWLVLLILIFIIALVGWIVNRRRQHKK